MKTIKYLFLALFICSTTYSQEKKSYGFEKGDIFISGAVNYAGDELSNAIYIQPSAGYFLTSNIALGLQSEFLVSDTNKFSSTNVFGAGINGRYYFMPKKRFNVFTELAFDYTKGNNESNFLGILSSSESKQLSATISTGVNFFITKNLSIFTKLDLWEYTKTRYEINSSDPIRNRTTTYTKYRSGIEDLSLGIKYKF